MYLHPICVAGHDNKLAILKEQGFFFLDDDKAHGEQAGRQSSRVSALRPF